MGNQYFVEQKIHDNGKVETTILTESEAWARGYSDGMCVENENFDLYVDGFPSYEKAESFAKQN